LILHLTSGSSTEKGLNSPTMGLRLESITFKGHDMHQLLQMSDEELRERLSVLYTRYAPFSQETVYAEN
jgi:hypothetical protein